MASAVWLTLAMTMTLTTAETTVTPVIKHIIIQSDLEATGELHRFPLYGGDSSGDSFIEILYGPSDDLMSLALEAVEVGRLGAGEGCASKECVAALVADALTKHRANPDQNYGALDKTYAVYAQSFAKFSAEQGQEDDAFRRRARNAGQPSAPSAVTAGSGEFGSVPCVPPHCDFECSAAAMGPRQLDALVEAAEAAAADMPWDGVESLHGPPPPAKLVALLARTMQQQGPDSVPGTVPGSLAGSVLGSHWPPPSRNCTALNRRTGQPVHPIRPFWIAIPEERVVSCVPRKVSSA